MRRRVNMKIIKIMKIIFSLHPPLWNIHLERASKTEMEWRCSEAGQKALFRGPVLQLLHRDPVWHLHESVLGQISLVEVPQTPSKNVLSMSIKQSTTVLAKMHVLVSLLMCGVQWAWLTPCLLNCIFLVFLVTCDVHWTWLTSYLLNCIFLVFLVMCDVQWA